MTAVIGSVSLVSAQVLRQGQRRPSGVLRVPPDRQRHPALQGTEREQGGARAGHRAERKVSELGM